MGEVAKEGRTVLFVSHNMAAVQRLCGTTAWIHQGELVELSTTPAVIQNYLSNQAGGLAEFRAEFGKMSLKKKGVHLLRVSVKDFQNRVAERITSGAPFFIEIEYFLENKVQNLRLGFRLVSADGIVIFTSGDTDPDGTGKSRQPGRYISRCEIPKNLLNTGRYYITATCDQPMQEIYFAEENIVSFAVEMIDGVGSSVPDGRYGVIRPSLSWQIEEVSHVQ
jgi:lipopolysaccharide transport system ATP-binding protein